MEKDVNQMNDHDLLVTMHEQIKGIKNDIKDLKDGTSTTLADHEARIRRLEVWGFTAVGLLLALEFYFNYLRK